jgi:hypothetical protein
MRDPFRVQRSFIKALKCFPRAAIQLFVVYLLWGWRSVPFWIVVTYYALYVFGDDD